MFDPIIPFNQTNDWTNWYQGNMNDEESRYHYI